MESAAGISILNTHPASRSRGRSRPKGDLAVLTWDTAPDTLDAYELAGLIRSSYGRLTERCRIERRQRESGYQPAPSNPIPAKKCGKNWRFDKAEARAWWLREGLVEPEVIRAPEPERRRTPEKR